MAAMTFVGCVRSTGVALAIVGAVISIVMWYPLNTSLEPINSQGCATRQWEPITDTDPQFPKHKRIFHSAVIDAPLPAVWNIIKGFANCSWTPIICPPEDPTQSPDLNIIGTRRVAEMNGKKVFEKLVEYSESQHMYSYHLDEKDKGLFPGNFTNYYGKIELSPLTDGTLQPGDALTTIHGAQTAMYWTISFDGEPGTADLVALAAAEGVQRANMQSLARYIIKVGVANKKK